MPINRRDWLKLSLLGSASLFFMPSLAVTTPINPKLTNQKKLIVILLRGAMDGLNVVVPYGDENYYRLRPTLALAKPNANASDSLLDLDGFFGLNPALKPLYTLWQNRELAFIHSSGSPSRSRSHFDAQDYMETATPDVSTTRTGWLNRLLVELDHTPNPSTGIHNTNLEALIISPNMPRIASGTHALTLISPGQSAGAGGYISSQKAHQLFDDLYQGQSPLAKAYQTAQSSNKDLQKTLAEQQAEQIKAANGGQSVHGFSADACQLATLMHARDDIGFGFFGLSGWDTHVNQGKTTGTLTNSLTSLANGLMELKQGLGQKWANTTVVVMSEFGRTAHENGYGGTDHGHGNVMWVLGGNIHGKKVYGNWSGLAENQLNEGRDLAVTTDFRQVLTDVIKAHYPLTPAQLAKIFPNFMPNAPLGMMV